MAKNPKNYFPLWFKRLEELAAVNNFVIDVKYKQSYREYFDDKYTPEETLEEEMDQRRKERAAYVLEEKCNETNGHSVD